MRDSVIGVTVVTEYIANALEKHTSLLYFLHVDKSVQVLEGGLARITVCVYDSGQ